MTEIELIVIQSASIRPLMSIPRRKVKPQIDPCLPGRLSQLANDISSPISPRAGADRVVGVLTGPQAKPIMVFGRENYARKSRVLGDSDPLSGVESRRVEDGGIRAAGAPLGVCEGIGPEVEEEGHVGELPLEL